MTLIDTEWRKFINPTSQTPSVRVTDFTIENMTQQGQLRPADTNAASIVSPGADETIVIAQILVTNTSVTDTTFVIYHDNDGTTYDETTAIYMGAVRSESTCPLNILVSLNQDAGNLAVKSNLGNALTFTVYGVTI